MKFVGMLCIHPGSCSIVTGLPVLHLYPTQKGKTGAFIMEFVLSVADVYQVL